MSSKRTPVILPPIEQLPPSDFIKQCRYKFVKGATKLEHIAKYKQILKERGESVPLELSQFETKVKQQIWCEHNAKILEFTKFSDVQKYLIQNKLDIHKLSNTSLQHYLNLENKSKPQLNHLAVVDNFVKSISTLSPKLKLNQIKWFCYRNNYSSLDEMPVALRNIYLDTKAKVDEISKVKDSNRAKWELEVENFRNSIASRVKSAQAMERVHKFLDSRAKDRIYKQHHQLYDCYASTLYDWFVEFSKVCVEDYPKPFYEWEEPVDFNRRLCDLDLESLFLKCCKYKEVGDFRIHLDKVESSKLITNNITTKEKLVQADIDCNGYDII